MYAGSQNGRVYRILKDSLVCLFDINQVFKDLYDLPNITFIKEPVKGQLWIGTSVGKMIRILIRKDGSYGPPRYYGLKEINKEQIVSASFEPAGRRQTITGRVRSIGFS